ncbi:MAG: VCBS repeat-containing protein [Lewinellaceae bacterium]|nr:VCBS repeat-containing protein [Lewinellaceae bacterium]
MRHIYSNILTIVFLLVGTIGRAQVSYISMHTDATIDAVTKDMSKPTGSTAGVSGLQNGASVYTIPLTLPTGAHGVAPDLALQYSSTGRSTAFGYGWGLTGLSAISRVGQSKYYDNNVTGVDYTNQDRYSLDGNRLVLLSGSYGSVGSVYGFEAENFSRITFDGTEGAPAYFIHEMKDGTKYTYGNSSDSKLIGTPPHIKDWYLSKITYPDGTYIEFHYSNLTYNGYSELVPDEIHYTGNAAAGLTPYAKVKFFYDQRYDANVIYHRNVGFARGYLVTKIEVSTENQLVRSYTPEYAFRNGNSYLTKITEKDGAGVGLNATHFKYGDEPTGSKVGATPRIIGTNDAVFPSNLNNDGITDLMIAHQTAMGYHDNFHGVSDAAFSVTLPTQSKVVGTADSNGDQIDEVLVLQTIDRQELIEDDPNLGPIYNYYQIYKFFLYHNAGLTGSLNYSTVYELPGMNDTIYHANAHLNSVYGGDFNGDGLADYIFINGANTYVAYGQRNITQPLTAWMAVDVTTTGFVPEPQWGNEVERLYVIEYDGDGKSDIFMVNGSTSIVLSFSGATQMEQKYVDGTGFFNQDMLIYPSDFNGDGRTDFLLRVDDNNSSVFWSRAINLGGQGFQSESFIFTHTPYVDQVDYGAYYGDVISTGDYNGDGRSDILLLGIEAGVGFYSDLYLSLGASMGSVLHEVNGNYAFNHSSTGADYAGIDGKARTLLRLFTTYDPLEIAFNAKSKEQLLTKIRNGEQHTTIYDYKLMTETIDQNDDFYVRGPLSPATETIGNVRIPSWLVKTYSSHNGTSAPSDYSEIYMKNQSCRYAEAKLHRLGKGIIGFGKEVLSDQWSYLRTTNYSSPQSTYGIMVPDSVLTEFVTGTDFVKAVTTQQTASLPGSRYITKATAMETHNYYENRKNEELYQSYDAYGNPTQITYSTYTGDSHALVEKRVVQTVYGAYGSMFPDKPTHILSTFIRPGAPNYTLASDIEYNSLGQVTRKKEFSGQPKQVITDFEYHPHGGIKTTTISAAGLPDKITRTDFDTKGRYITSLRNTDNDTIYKATYDIVAGKPTSTTDAADVTTQFTYDSWGRLHTMTTPAGAVYTHTYAFVTSPGIKKETVTSILSPTKTTYYDRLNRPVATTKDGFEGSLITESQTYDYRGNVVLTKDPYKAGEAQLTHGMFYDVAYTSQRLKSSNTNISAFGTTTYAYTYDQGVEVTTTTAPDGKVTSTKIDASGRVLQTTDSHGTTLDYTYYAHGGIKEVKRGDTVLVSNVYDIYHRKSSMTDISAGTTQYVYDAYGRLTSETNPRGQTTTTVYDKYDRPTTVTRPEGTTTYTYYPKGGASTGKAFKLQQVTGFSGDIHAYFYDVYGRLFYEKETIDGVEYITQTSHDTYDRVTSMTLPSGVNLQYEYDPFSYLKRLYSGSTTYATVNEVNGRGQITKYTLGDGRQSIHSYYYGIPTKYRTADDAYYINMLWDYKNGNLKKRWDNSGNRDTMAYDDLDRLIRWDTHFSIGGMHSDTISYATNGNITKKSDVGTYTYDGMRIHAVTEITNEHGVIKDAEQHITYTSFLQPDTITEGAYRLIYTYGYDGQRIKSRLYNNGVLVETKYYGDHFEKVVSAAGETFVDYLTLQGRVVTIIESTGSSHTPHYIYTDHLGSIVMASSSTGVIEATQNFDPWGRLRYASTWELVDENLPQTYPVWLYRGFTGQEHLRPFHLINMNARLYDPEAGRMLTPDNVVQAAGYSQSFNRYSYAYNNPLKYTDPNGNEPVTIIAVSIITSVVINSLSNMIQNKPMFEGTAEAIFWAVSSSVISFGIGEAAQSLFQANAYLRGGFQLVAHGVANGAIAELEGGKFIHGFAAGSVSSLGGSVADALNKGTVTKFFIGGVTGGLAESAAGGQFAHGFAKGVIVTLMNHQLHGALEGGPGDPPRTKAELIEGLKMAYANGDINEVEFNTTMTYLEGGPLSVISDVLWDHKWEIGLTIAGGVLIKYLGRGLAYLSAGSSEAKLSSNGVKLAKQLASESQMAEEGITIVSSGNLKEAARLSQQYGGKAVDWVKKTSTSFSKNGIKFETHWYENITTGLRTEFKTKFF